MTVNQISVFLENTPGQLLKLTKTLENNNIDIRALSLADAKDFGIARIIVDDPYACTQALKVDGYVASLTPVIAVEMPDKPGSFAGLLNVISEAGINLEYTYAFSAQKKDSAYMILRADKPEELAQVLGANNFIVMRASEMNKI